MLLAHLPAGYLLINALKLNRNKSLMVTALVASILPDADIIYYFCEGGVKSHRYYCTHWPLFWLSCFLPAVLMSYKHKKIKPYITVFFAAITLHLFLDLIAGPIFLLAPFKWDAFRFVHVQRVYDHWFLNLARHWVFWLEFPIILSALIMACNKWVQRNIIIRN